MSDKNQVWSKKQKIIWIKNREILQIKRDSETEALVNTINMSKDIKAWGSWQRTKIYERVNQNYGTEEIRIQWTCLIAS